MRLTNVFVIDDDETFVFLTKRIIDSARFNTNVKEFSDGQEAINYLKQIAPQADLLPDLIFLDLNMPVMDGWEFINEYQRIEATMAKKIKLYIVSSSISPHEIERSKNYSFVSDFITKPLVKAKFTEIVENLYNNS